MCKREPALSRDVVYKGAGYLALRLNPYNKEPTVTLVLPNYKVLLQTRNKLCGEVIEDFRVCMFSILDTTNLGCENIIPAA